MVSCPPARVGECRYVYLHVGLLAAKQATPTPPLLYSVGNGRALTCFYHCVSSTYSSGRVVSTPFSGHAFTLSILVLFIFSSIVTKLR